MAGPKSPAGSPSSSTAHTNPHGSTPSAPGSVSKEGINTQHSTLRHSNTQQSTLQRSRLNTQHSTLNTQQVSVRGPKHRSEKVIISSWPRGLFGSAQSSSPSPA